MWKDIERFVKKLRGKDVPEIDLDLPDEVIDLLAAAQKIITKQALAMVENVPDKAWDALNDFSPGIIPKEQFDAVIKAVVDVIKKEVFDEEEA